MKLHEWQLAQQTVAADPWMRKLASLLAVKASLEACKEPTDKIDAEIAQINKHVVLTGKTYEVRNDS